MDVRHNNNALQELNDCIRGLLHLGLNVITVRTLLHLEPNVITFRTLLHLGPNVITFRTLLHLGQLLHLGPQQSSVGGSQSFNYPGSLSLCKQGQGIFVAQKR